MTLERLKHIARLIAFRDWRFVTGEMGDGSYLQAIFIARDSVDGRARPQRARKWYISHYATESEVVLTALKAVLTALEHEAREVFTYNGVALFGPHVDVHALMACAEQQDRRQEVV